MKLFIVIGIVVLGMSFLLGQPKPVYGYPVATNIKLDNIYSEWTTQCQFSDETVYKTGFTIGFKLDMADCSK
jgi:hypothetical protein